jgi:hypothetical protein
MEDQILRKIRAELERGITEECQVVYLLVEIRKLLDRDGKNAEPYNSLRLCSDWAVHVSLSWSRAQNIVIQADAYYPKLLSGTLSEEEKNNFQRMFSLDAFREEMNYFLRDKGLPLFSDAGWNLFLTAFLNVIEDCPLLYKAQGAAVTHVDELVVIRVPREASAVSRENSQAIYWGLRFKGKFMMSIGGYPELSEEVENAIDAFIQQSEE